MLPVNCKVWVSNIKSIRLGFKIEVTVCVCINVSTLELLCIYVYIYILYKCLSLCLCGTKEYSFLVAPLHCKCQ